MAGNPLNEIADMFLKQYVEVGSSTGIHKNIQEKTHLIGG
jgi:hypothetical protein